MLRLPFNKWTLQFYDELHAQKYQTFKNEMSEKIIQAQCILFSIALSTCLIAFILQHQHISQIITTAFGIVWCLSILFLRKKAQKFIQYFLFINYIILFVFGVLLQIFQQQIPLFSIGFISGQVLIFSLYLVDFKIKIVLLPSTGFIILAIDNLYQSEYFYIIIFQIVSLLTQIMLNYIFEFTNRAAFVLNLITIKQQEIINEFVNDGLIGIGFDLQSRQFNLEFKNRTSEYLLNIKDNDTLRQFIRSCIVLNSSSTNKNLDEIKKRPIGKRTLEDFLFARTLDKLSNEHTSWEIEIIQTFNKIEKKLKVELKTMDFGKPILTLIIKSHEVPKLISKYEQTIKKLQKIITNQSQHYAIISQKMSLELKQISQQMDINLQNLQCSNNLIMNTLKNYIIYFSSSKLDMSKENNKMCKFDDFITQIQQFFNQMSQKHQKRIFISNYLQDSQIIKTNLNLLCQLITNLFETILYLSKDFTKLNLNFFPNSSFSDIQLSINQTSNKIQNNSFVSEMKKDLFQSFDSINDYQMQIEQEILHFCFSFISDFQIMDILNFDNTLLQKQSNSNEYFIISNKVSQYLISLLGPYNDIFTVCDKFQDSYSIQINFYIYKNQSKVLQSFAMQQHYDDLFQGDLDF